MNPFQSILIMAIRAYRAVVSPVLSALCTPFGLGCRFTPTCSQYGLDAVKMHGAWRGSLLSIRRVCRCHPWGGEGYDPVPEGGAKSEDEEEGRGRARQPDGARFPTTKDEGRARQLARAERPPLRASTPANS